MEHFKNINNEIFAYNNKQVAQGYGKDLQSITEAEVDAIRKAEEQKRLDDLTYVEKRAIAYPSWQDQLDDIYHYGIEGWKIRIKSVKDVYPKPTAEE